MDNIDLLKILKGGGYDRYENDKTPEPSGQDLDDIESQRRCYGKFNYCYYGFTKT